jgi:hypothetical protein
MTLHDSMIRDSLVADFEAASGYAGGCTPRQRESAHYERGRKDGIARALELVDSCLRSEDGGRTPAMITRQWRGWTAPENADAYERFLLGKLFPAMRDIDGFLGADVLRRAADDEVAFVTLTRFDSVDAIRAFAGEDPEIPVLEPQALALLSRYDERAQHFETATFSV